MTATLNDIAKLTGVDKGSISRVLRNHPRAMDLRPETRERIVEAARKLGYRRNELAATMRTGTTRTVAVISSYVRMAHASSSYNTVLSGILKEASRVDYGVKIYADDNLASCVDKIMSHQIKHVLSMSVDHQQRVETATLCRLHSLKLVFVYEDSQGEFPAVTTANRIAARDVVLHFAGLGHRRIALICGPHQFNYVNELHAGYVQGLAEAGLEQDQQLIACGEELEPRERAIEAMLRMPSSSRPTAFFCIGDLMAMWVQRAAFKNKLRVPEDVSVIGYGNSELGEAAVTPLSSVDQPYSQMGETALRVLLGLPCDDLPSPVDGCYLLPNKLITRDSVARRK